MRHFRFALFFFALLTCNNAGYAQTDNEYIAHAKITLQDTKNCGEALRSLMKVSAAGKATEDYYLYMGKANDCKANNAQAIFYYNKYLELRPTDSIKKRVAELTDNKAQQDRVNSQINSVKKGYSDAVHNHKNNHSRHRKHDNIYDPYMLISGSYNMATGGVDAPFKSGLGISTAPNFPIANHHVLLGYALDADYLFGPNKPWFSRVSGTPEPQVSGVNSGISGGLSFIPQAVIINKKRLSLTAGPFVGGGFYYTPSVSETFNGGTFDDEARFCLIYGLQANVMIGPTLTITVKYTATSLHTVGTDYAGITTNTTVETPVNHNMFSIGIGARTEDFWDRW